MLQFLNNWTLDLTNIPDYSEFKKPFLVPCDEKLCNNLVSGTSPEITQMMISNFRNNVVPYIKNNTLSVTHYQAKKLGRFYCSN